MTVALLGNPNTGKSTLFSALVGVRQRTGNYPGVTVEKKVGRTTIGETACDVIDLPGTYSLAPHSPDEMVAVDVLLGRQAESQRPDVIVCIVDASNLSRNLYLVSQLIELQRPLVVALNMVDVASDKGVQIDVERLSQNLGLPVIPIQANRKQGIERLTAAITEAVENQQGGVLTKRDSPLPPEWQAEVTALETLSSQVNGSPLPRYLLERLVLDTGYLETADLEGVTPPVREAVAAARSRFTTDGQSPAVMETIARYQWVAQITDGVLTQTTQTRVTASDRLDHVLTHRVWGPLIFATIMLVIFQAVFNGAVIFMDLIEAWVGSAGDWIGAHMPDGALQSLMVDGVVGGVGSVLVFLPQIVILFFFIAVLEDC
ncbi:MAG: ferrous iron transporter B, partial [Planctomycetales bacterium]|nr:ferrous iron transporter B [Planctomycetales bacterium]